MPDLGLKGLVLMKKKYGEARIKKIGVRKYFLLKFWFFSFFFIFFRFFRPVCVPVCLYASTLACMIAWSHVKRGGVYWKYKNMTLNL